MEMMAFPIWQKSSAAKKKKIIEKLARRQVDMIMEDIEKQCQCPSKN